MAVGLLQSDPGTEAEAPLAGAELRPAAAVPRHRMFALDVLRGLAVLLVVVFHWPGRSSRMGPFAPVSAVGWAGVDLIFVLSGFLISGLLFTEWDRTGSLNLRRFWLRRGFKIWPAYFAAFGLVMALRAVPNFRDGGAAAVLAEWRRYLPSAVFVQNYFPERRQWPYTWSVAVEEHFYLALPLLMLGLAALQRRRRAEPTLSPVQTPGDATAGSGPPLRLLPLACMLVCVAALAMRVAAVRRGTTWDQIHFPTHLRADALSFGVLVGYFHRYHPAAFGRVCRRWPLLLAAVPATLLALYLLKTSPVTYTLGFTLLYLAFGGLVALAAYRPNFGSGSAPARWVAAVGRYSYTIYLSHGAMQMLPRYGRTMTAVGHAGGPWAQRALFVTLAFTGGVLLARLVELPMLRLRDRWFPSRSLGPPRGRRIEMPSVR